MSDNHDPGTFWPGVIVLLIVLGLIFGVFAWAILVVMVQA